MGATLRDGKLPEEIQTILREKDPQLLDNLNNALNGVKGALSNIGGLSVPPNFGRKVSVTVDEALSGEVDRLRKKVRKLNRELSEKNELLRAYRIVNRNLEQTIEQLEGDPHGDEEEDDEEEREESSTQA